MKIECEASDVERDDLLLPHDGYPPLRVREVEPRGTVYIDLWGDGRRRRYRRTDSVTVERGVVADEGFECPVCRTRYETEEEREACVVAHDEEAAGV